jgi:hypothetical protein
MGSPLRRPHLDHPKTRVFMAVAVAAIAVLVSACSPSGDSIENATLDRVIS